VEREVTKLFYQNQLAAGSRSVRSPRDMAARFPRIKSLFLGDPLKVTIQPKQLLLVLEIVPLGETLGLFWHRQS